MKCNSDVSMYVLDNEIDIDTSQLYFINYSIYESFNRFEVIIVLKHKDFILQKI